MFINPRHDITLPRHDITLSRHDITLNADLTGFHISGADKPLY